MVIKISCFFVLSINKIYRVRSLKHFEKYFGRVSRWYTCGNGRPEVQPPADYSGGNRRRRDGSNGKACLGCAALRISSVDTEL